MKRTGRHVSDATQATKKGPWASSFADLPGKKMHLTQTEKPGEEHPVMSKTTIGKALAMTEMFTK